MKTMSKMVLLMGLVALLSTGCGKDDLTVPDFNNPSVEDLQTNPSPAGIAAAAQGLLFDTRNTVAGMVEDFNFQFL